MKIKQCGRTELKLSVLGVGCWAFGGGDYWGEQDQKDVNEVVRRSFELGVNFFDTAESYNEGRSELSLGKAIRELPRDRIIIGTKISPSNTYPKTLVEHCEASLARLNTDYIDLYMVHWPIHPHSIRHFTDDEFLISHPPEAIEAFETMVKLRDQGKIRYISVSNFGIHSLKAVLASNVQIISNELPYSLLTRAIEFEILPFCKSMGIGVISYMTLLQGLLTDIYQSLDDVPAWQRRTRHYDSRKNKLARHGEYGAELETNQALEEIRKIVKKSGHSMFELAIQWAIRQVGISCVLVGARNLKELEANVKATNASLSDPLYDRLNIVTKPLMEKMGQSFDYYEHTDFDRTK